MYDMLELNDIISLIQFSQSQRAYLFSRTNRRVPHVHTQFGLTIVCVNLLIIDKRLDLKKGVVLNTHYRGETNGDFVLNGCTCFFVIIIDIIGETWRNVRYLRLRPTSTKHTHIQNCTKRILYETELRCTIGLNGPHKYKQLRFSPLRKDLPQTTHLTCLISLCPPL